MRREIILCVFACLWGGLCAQEAAVVMRINGRAITKERFEQAYAAYQQSNKPAPKTPRQYANVFIIDQLKIESAEQAGLDTLSSLKSAVKRYQKEAAKELLRARLISSKPDSLEMPVEQLQVAHLFYDLPQNCTNDQMGMAERLMDSLYTVAQSGTSDIFAGSGVPRAVRKETFWLARKEETVEFENVAFALKEGEISQPFYTASGIHLLKLLDKRTSRQIESSVLERRSYSAFIRQLKEEGLYKPDETAAAEILATGDTKKVLFVLGNRSYTGADFGLFAQTLPVSRKRQLSDFILKSVLDFEYNRIVNGQPDIRIARIRDSLLLAAVTERVIAIPAASDEAGLKAYYESHESDYKWDPPRYKGIVAHCADRNATKLVKKVLKNKPFEQWETLLAQAFPGDKRQSVIYEIGVFSIGDHPDIDKKIFKQGHYKSVPDHSGRVIEGKKINYPESYTEIREALVPDYKKFLTALWIKKLQANAHVEINEEILKTVNNH